MPDEFETDFERYVRELLKGKTRMEQDEILGEYERKVDNGEI